MDEDSIPVENSLDDQFEEIFCREIIRQSKFGLIGISQINAGLQNRETTLLWYGVQSALVAGGNISKLLWPPRERIPGRGHHLRRILGVDKSHFLAPRSFRNHFEHFDERLEQWALDSGRRNFVDECIFSTGAIVGLEGGGFLRNYDQNRRAVTFRGDSYPLQSLADAFVDIQQRATPFTEPRWVREQGLRFG